MATPTTIHLQERDGGVWLLGPSRQPLLDLVPEVEVVHDGRRRRLRPTATLRRQGTSWLVAAIATLPTVRITIELRLPEKGVAATLTVGRHYRKRTRVGRELLRFRLAPKLQARVLDRSYRLRESSARQPRLLAGMQAPAWVLLEGDGLHLAWQGSPSLASALLKFRPQGGSLELELDHAANHPLRAYPRCQPRLRSFDPARRRRDRIERKIGETLKSTGRWLLAPQAIVVVERYPHGYQSALALTDHADQSSADKLEAFAFGATGALARQALGKGHPGFVNRGLRYTKSIFLAQARAYDRQFDDPRYRRVLAAMEARGVEIGVHSVSGDRDTPQRTARLLQTFRRVYRGRSWIDHQPYTNCEALSMHGLDRGSGWYVLDKLAAAGLRYVWTVPDMPLVASSLDQLRGRSATARRASIYRHPRLRVGDHHFTAFRSVMLFQPRRRLLARFGRAALDRLAEDHGLLIGHTYLDSFRARGAFHDKTLLRPRVGGGYELRPDVDALFERLAKRQTRGALWVTGVEALAHHLLTALAIDLAPSRDGALQLSSREPIEGVSVRLFVLGAGRPSLRLDNVNITLHPYQASWRTVLPGRIGPKVRKLSVELGGVPKALAPPVRVERLP